MIKTKKKTHQILLCLNNQIVKRSKHSFIYIYVGLQKFAWVQKGKSVGKSKVKGGAALVTGPRENSLSGSQFSHSHKLRLELN